MTRHQANREARRLIREAGLRALDPTDPEEPANVELVEAIRWANVSRTSRPRTRANIQFNVFRVFDRPRSR